MAKSRKRRTLKKRGGNKNWTFTNFVRQDVNSADPSPPNAPQGPLGGRRKHRGGNPGGEYTNPPYPSSPPTGPFKGGRKTRRVRRGRGYY